MRFLGLSALTLVISSFCIASVLTYNHLEEQHEDSLSENITRVKRSQGPIVELYYCILKLFIPRACHNRFENNKESYRRYLLERERKQNLQKLLNSTSTTTPVSSGIESTVNSTISVSSS